MGMRIVFQILIVMIIINCFFVSIPESEGGSCCFFIWISLNQGEGEQEIDMKLGEDFEVIINGYVDCSHVLFAFEKYIVNLSTNSRRRWETNIHPSIIEFNNTSIGVANFSVTVIVPSGIKAYSQEKIEIYCNGTGYPNLHHLYAYQEATIKVKQYHDLQIKPIDPFKKIVDCTKTTYKMNITNNGNGLDILNLSISNRDHLERSGLRFEFSEIVELTPFNSRIIDLVVDSTNAKPGKYNIDLSVKSDLMSPDQNASKTTKLVVHIEERSEYFLVLIIILTVIFFLTIITGYFVKKRHEKKNRNMKRPD